MTLADHMLRSLYAHERRLAAFKRMHLAVLWERAERYAENALQVRP